MQESSQVEFSRCNKTLLKIQKECNYSEFRFLASCELHIEECNGTHYDKLYEACVTKYINTVRQKGHKNKNTHKWET